MSDSDSDSDGEVIIVSGTSSSSSSSSSSSIAAEVIDIDDDSNKQFHDLAEGVVQYFDGFFKPHDTKVLATYRLYSGAAATLNELKYAQVWLEQQQNKMKDEVSRATELNNDEEKNKETLRVKDGMNCSKEIPG